MLLEDMPRPYCLLSGAFCACATLWGSSPISFNAPLTYLTGGPVTGAAVGDFNGDGKPDIAVTSNYGNSISIFLGKGDGTFQAPVPYAVGSGPAAVAVGDFNRDGKLDLAVTANTGNGGIGTLSILFGNGDGTFQPAVNYPLGRSPAAIAIGDFNNDGNPDLAIIDVSGLSDIYILLGAPDGAFQLTETYPAGMYPGGVVTGDFNGDGNLDLAIAASGYDQDGAGVIVMLGNGDGTFQPTLRLAAGDSPAYLVAADFNGDGRLDLAVSDTESPARGVTGVVLLFLGNGDGTFQPPDSLYVPGSSASYMAAADFNNDGNLDLAVSTQKGLDLLLGKGDGTFEPAVNVTPVSGYLTVADFNADGLLDLATATGTLTVLLQGPGLTYPHDMNFYAGGALSSIASGDFNGDGYLDLVAADTNSASIAVLLGNGDGTFQTAAYYGAAKAAMVKVADMNGDGNLDLVICDGTISVMLGNGQGQFGPPQVTPALNARFLAIDDFNLDGKLDLAVSTATGLVILLGNGDGTFQPPLQIPTQPDSGSLAVGDFNHDGKLDIALTAANLHTVSILLGKGDGSFYPEVSYDVGDYPSSVAVGHFSGPQSQDLAVTNYGVEFLYGTVSVLLNNSDGTFQPAVNYEMGDSPGYVVVGDFNADGKADLAVANTWSSAVSILPGNGDGTFQTPVSFFAKYPYALAIGDFNGDGKGDLAVAAFYGVTLLTNTTP